MTNRFRGPSGQPAVAGDPISLSQVNAALDTLDGNVSSTKVQLPAKTPTPVLGTILADEHLLRLYGAAFDGVTDDLPAFQGIVTDARVRTPSIILVPTVTFSLGGLTVLLSGPVQTGTCNVAFIGAAPNVCTMSMVSGGAGLIQHGTSSTPAVGYLHLQGFSLLDGNITGSGSAGVSMQFAATAPQTCLTIKDVSLRKWTRPVEMTNAPRGVEVDNVTVFGPDYAIQSAPAFKIVSTADFTAGCFSYDWSSVFTVNYRNGWEYHIASALEGQVFVGCRSYDGWGMVQVRNTVTGGYKSLLWSFTDCDWQGLGFAFDMENCRQITARGGFWIANLNSAALAIPNGALRRRYFSFVGCIQILLEGIQAAVLPSQTDALSVFYFDGNCLQAKVKDAQIISFSTLYAGFEIATNLTANAIRETDTDWVTWSGGPRIMDGNNNQAMQTNARWENVPSDGRGFYGDCDSQGRWDLRFRTGSLTTDSNSRIAIPFPTRPGGSPFFIGGTPSAQVMVENNYSNITQPSIYSVTSTGVVMQFPPGTGAGLVVAFDVSVGGF